MKKYRFLVSLLAVVALVAACGDDDSDTSANGGDSETTAPNSGDSDDVTADDNDNSADPAAGAGDGALVVDGEEIALDARCHLQPQEAAAGGGQILFVAQGNGETADGEPVLVDISRYDEDSDFAGDSINVVIGDFTQEGALDYTVMGESGLASLDGSTVTVSDLEMEAYTEDDIVVSNISVTIAC